MIKDGDSVPPEVAEILARIKSLTVTIEQHREAMSQAKGKRLSALDELQELGYSGSDIARMLGLSRQRVSQLRNKN